MESQNRQYVVMTAATTPSSTCWGSYRRVALVHIDRDKLPEDRDLPIMISSRARGVVEIVKVWENCNVGTSDRCAYAKALAAANELAAKLNGEIEGGTK